MAALHQYRELAPAPTLRPFVECCWRATSQGQPGFRPTELLVPHLRVEMIFYKRLFARHIGLSPKHFARVARLQHVLDLCSARPRLTLSQLAAAGGYSDQAHFNRDFRVLIGRTPSDFFAERFAVFETMARSGSLDIKPF